MLANNEEGCELGVQHPVGVTTVGEVTTTRVTAKLLIYLKYIWQSYTQQRRTKKS